MGAIRYVKARRRGQHLTCWRFLSARLNALLRSYSWKAGGPRFSTAGLNTWDFAALDRCLPEADRLRWLAQIDCRTPRAMDDAMVCLSHQVTERIYPGWAVDDAPEAGLIREMLSFIEQELACPGVLETKE